MEYKILLLGDTVMIERREKDLQQRYVSCEKCKSKFWWDFVGFDEVSIICKECN